MGYMEVYKQWCEDSCFDAETRAELAAIAGNEKEIEDRFYKNLDFGTGGLRGVTGAGTNRMNIYTVRRATQGLANYILKQNIGGEKMGVAIAHDSRRFSPEFTEAAALVLCGNGIKTYVFNSLRPTPVLSFAVRELCCVAGVVVTASHNPPEYNGYKVYWSDGGQVPYPRDEAIIDEVNAVEDFAAIPAMDKAEALAKGLLNVIDASLDDKYIENVKAQSVCPDVAAALGDSFKIVYTPLHGTGNLPVRRALAELGFKQVFVVPEQEKPDGGFPTVGYPNPEDPKAFALAMKLADEIGADIVCATDPDADRVGAVVRDAKGEYIILTGNMTGALLTEYILSHKKADGTFPANGAVVSTIVSTNMARKIAEAYDAAYFDVLTGFKYIGEKIKEFEQNDSHSYLFGFEESYGCLAGTYARDKDAVVATMLLCEMAAYYKQRGMSLYDGLQELYAKYGYYKETIESITMKGVEGVAQIKQMMSDLREAPPTVVNGVAIAEMRDYKACTVKRADGTTTPTGLPVSDVLYGALADESWFAIRPSGTEPKIKIYFGVKGESQADADAKLVAFAAAVMDIVKK